MNWISLVLQLITLRRSFEEAHSVTETARHYAERGKRALVSVLVMSIAALFWFSALLIAVIELGLQIDRGNGIFYSGLMVSATILVVLGLILMGMAYLVGRGESAPPPPPPSASPRAERIKDLLEDFLASFLRQLAKSGEKKSEQKPE
jgi:hypothetical protein